jgi:Flp pilus assembly protein TadD
MGAGTFLDLGRRWLRRPEMLGAANEFVSAGVELHPKNAELHELFGDVLLKRGQRDQASAHYRLAYDIDSKIAKGASFEDYIAARMRAN